MHELSIIQQVAEIVLAEMPQHNLQSISKISLRIGAMRQVVPEALRFAFDCLRPGTPMESARLLIEMVPVRGKCRHCQNEYPVDNWLDPCPECGDGNMEIVAGKELEIIEIEGEVSCEP